MKRGAYHESMGYLLLVGAGTMFWFYKAYGYRKRITVLLCCKMRFRLLETEIFYTLTPVPVAMAALEPKIPDALQQFFHRVWIAMEQEQQPVFRAWEQGMLFLERATFCGAEELGCSAQLWLELGGRRFAGAAEKFSVIAAKAELCAGRSRTAAAAARKGLAVYGCLRQYGCCDYFVLGRTIDGN